AVGGRHAVPEDRLPELRVRDVVPGAGEERFRRLRSGHLPSQQQSRCQQSAATDLATTLSLPPTWGRDREGGSMNEQHQTFRNESSLVHSPFSCWNFTDLSTRIWPSSESTMRARSSGRGAGPSKLTPVL